MLGLGYISFFISRFLIFIFYGLYISDVEFYLELSQKGLQNHQTAYQDFFFPYPPLALPFVYFPGLFELKDFYKFHPIFSWEMFLLEFISVYYLVQFCRKKLNWNEQNCFILLFSISVLGMLQGHLIFDRLDVGVSLAITMMLYFSSMGKTWLVRLVGMAGALFKVIPLMVLVPLQTAYVFTQKKKNPFLRLMIETLTYTAPVILFLLAYDKWVGPGLFKYLFQHEERGIQIESVWATPFMLFKVLSPDTPIAIENVFGAHHLVPNMVPGFYLFLSKITGILAYGAIVLRLIYKAWKKNIWVTSPLMNCFTALSVLIIFLATQRVLSPQYFIWLIGLLSIYGVYKRSIFHWILILCVYALTYVEFDLGYIPLVQFDPMMVISLVFRNIFLVWLTVLIIKDWDKISVQRTN